MAKFWRDPPESCLTATCQASTGFHDFDQALKMVYGLAPDLDQEPEEGNVEYKLRLVNVTPERQTRLASQMNWRLNESPAKRIDVMPGNGGAAEARYMLGYGDDGSPAGLSDEDLVASLCTLRAIAARIDAEVSIVAVRWGSGGDIGGGSGSTIARSSTKVAEVRVRRVLLSNHNSASSSNEDCAESFPCVRSRETGGPSGVDESFEASATSKQSSSASSPSSSSDDDEIADISCAKGSAASAEFEAKVGHRGPLRRNDVLLPMVVAVVGDASAGKTTLASVLATGEVDNGRGLARMQVLRHHHEINEGHTSSRAPVLLAFDANGGVANFDERISDCVNDSPSRAIAAARRHGASPSSTFSDAEAELVTAEALNSGSRAFVGPVSSWGTQRNTARCSYSPGFGNVGSSGCDGSGGGCGSFISNSFSATELLRKAGAEGGKLVELLDLAGHRRYLKTTVSGLVTGSGSAPPDYAMLVVDAAAACEQMVTAWPATSREEEAIPEGAWPLGAVGAEHLSIASALGLRIFVVATKCELCSTRGLQRVLAVLSEAVVGASSRPVEPVRVRTHADALAVCERLRASTFSSCSAIRAGATVAVMAADKAASLSRAYNPCVAVPIICVSAVTGAGMNLLRDLLFRLPPDRYSARRVVDGLLAPLALSGPARSGDNSDDFRSFPSSVRDGGSVTARTDSTTLCVRVDESFAVEGAPGLVLAGEVQNGIVCAGAVLLLGPFARRRVPLGAHHDGFALSTWRRYDGEHQQQQAKKTTRRRQKKATYEDANSVAYEGATENEPSFFRRVRVASIHLHGVAVASSAAGQVATFAVSVMSSEPGFGVLDVWPLQKRCKGMILVGYGTDRSTLPVPRFLHPARAPPMVLEFDAEVIFLLRQQVKTLSGYRYEPSLKVGHEPMVYVQSVAQTARIASIIPRPTAETQPIQVSAASMPSHPSHIVVDIRFQFVHRPECVSTSDWFFLRCTNWDSGAATSGATSEQLRFSEANGKCRMGIGRITRCHQLTSNDMKNLVDYSQRGVRHKGDFSEASTKPDFWG